MADPLPYGRHLVDEADIAAVTEILRSDWLTTGPGVESFETAFAAYVGAEHAVAVSSGTAALHLCMLAAGIGPGDEVIVPALTFVASANCVRFVGADVVFADVRDDTLSIDVDHAAALLTERTRAIIAVDYAGLPCDLAPLTDLAARQGLLLVEDACHALGAKYQGRRIGSLADLSAFSFHPVKHVTTAEGGMVTTQDGGMAKRLRALRNHGITRDHQSRASVGTWEYDVASLGFNYRLSDLQCALGESQLSKAPGWLARRRELAARYRTVLSARTPWLRLPVERADSRHAYHLYPVRLFGENPAVRRRELFGSLRAQGIGVNVHYRPVYLHTIYRDMGYEEGICPVAEDAYRRLLSLPMWHGMTDDELHRVAESLQEYEGRHESG